MSIIQEAKGMKKISHPAPETEFTGSISTVRSSMTTVKKESSESDTEGEEDTPPAQKRSYRNAVVRKQNNVKPSEDSSGDVTAGAEHAVETEHLRRIRRARVVCSPSPVERISTRRREKKRSTDEEEKQKNSRARRPRGRSSSIQVKKSNYADSDFESSSDDEESKESSDSDDAEKAFRSGGAHISLSVKKSKYAASDSDSESSEDVGAVATKACGRKVAPPEGRVKVSRGKPAQKSASTGAGSYKNLPESSLKASLSMKRSVRRRKMPNYFDQALSTSEPSRKKRCEKESDSDSEYKYEED
ncbi:hypothetical protein B9Z55_023840 [Caenorhabditis nigoni]|uniref:Uncharacterized protein n=1 Tax=Caenorhabditis nigoni TaxID=1611254 RepID=A0A2G5SRR3_9PELO|nr:hypothetical protein B9Z55_023840 [Caenorhabditis nigoni]